MLLQAQLSQLILAQVSFCDVLEIQRHPYSPPNLFPLGRRPIQSSHLLAGEQKHTLPCPCEPHEHARRFCYQRILIDCMLLTSFSDPYKMPLQRTYILQIVARLSTPRPGAKNSDTLPKGQVCSIPSPFENPLYRHPQCSMARP